MQLGMTLPVMEPDLDIGTDEVHLIPTSSDVSQVALVVDVVAGLARSSVRRN